MELNRNSRLSRLLPSKVPPSPARRQAAARNSSAYALAAWYWNRLRCMSLREIGYRVAQRVSTKAQQHAGIGIASEIPIPDLTRRIRPFIAVDAVVDPIGYGEAADRLLRGSIPVFDREYSYDDLPTWNRDPKTGKTVPLTFGKVIDYRNEDEAGDIKYLWEINRHLDLVVLAQAYRLTQDKKYLDELRRLLESWLDQCPYPL